MSETFMAAISAISFFLGAFFSGCETAFIASDRVRLHHLHDEGDNKAGVVLQFLNNPRFFMSSVLVGTNLAAIGCTSTLTAILTHHFGDRGASIAVITLVPLFLIFNEMLPKGFFLYYATRAAVVSAYPLKVFSIILYPVVKAFSMLTDFMLKVSSLDDQNGRVKMTMEELLFHLEDSREAGLISEETAMMAMRASDLKRIRAGDIMIPLDSVILVEEGLSVKDYKEQFIKHGFSRMPVYRGEPDKVIGVLSIHSLLKDSLSRQPEHEPPYFVEENESVVKILARMKTHGCHMAFVGDPKSGAKGMLTMEDIIERLVGAIADEFH